MPSSVLRKHNLEAFRVRDDFFFSSLFSRPQGGDNHSPRPRRDRCGLQRLWQFSCNYRATNRRGSIDIPFVGIIPNQLPPRLTRRKERLRGAFSFGRRRAQRHDR